MYMYAYEYIYLKKKKNNNNKKRSCFNKVVRVCLVVWIHQSCKHATIS